MNLHEYQAKQLLTQYGVAIPFGRMAVSAEEAEEIAVKFQGPWVIKAQVHAGGRGKAGGIKMVNSLQELKSKAAELLGKELVTHQSGSQGKIVRKILIEEKISFQKEYYLALTTDRGKAAVSILASRHGGMEIEEMAQKHPKDLWVEAVDLLTGILSFQIRRVAKVLGVNGKETVHLGILLKQLYKLYTESELSLLEINPLVFGKGIKSKEIEWIALDAKMSADDNALFRHQNLEILRDLNEEDPAEVEAAQYGLSYVRLSGNIGCMVNGAGLAMATLDEIKNHGLEPANFLDIGGGANSERVSKAIEIITSDARVQGILINIFGGITQCDQVAQGVIDALKGKQRLLPMFVRLEGTRVEEGRKLFQATTLPITSVANLSEAAKEIKKQLNQGTGVRGQESGEKVTV